MLRYLTAGESHGQALTGILDGIPAGLELSSELIDRQLQRRQMGYGRGDRMKIEHDQVEILSGIRYGITTGAPISLLIKNLDWENWIEKTSITPVSNPSEPLTMPRPGHADYAGVLKYHLTDIRTVIERASARETAMRVAIGAICRELLSQFDIRIASHVRRIGKVSATTKLTNYDVINSIADGSLVRCIDPNAEHQMIQEIDKCKLEGDTLGGEFEVISINVPIGLGSYVQADRRLDGQLAQAVMSIPAIKSVSIGDIEDGCLSGAQFHDQLNLTETGSIHRTSNHSGGIEGGISNGELIIIRAMMKPLASLRQSLRSIDLATNEPTQALKERSDVCAVPAASIVGEHVVAFVLAKELLAKIGGDSIAEMKCHFAAWGNRWDTFSSRD